MPDVWLFTAFMDEKVDQMPGPRKITSIGAAKELLVELLIVPDSENSSGPRFCVLRWPLAPGQVE